MVGRIDFVDDDEIYSERLMHLAINGSASVVIDGRDLLVEAERQILLGDAEVFAKLVVAEPIPVDRSVYNMVKACVDERFVHVAKSQQGKGPRKRTGGKYQSKWDRWG